MKVWHELVDEHEERPAEKKTYDGRQKTQRPVYFSRTFNGRNK